MTYLLTGLPALLREAGLTVTVADDAQTNRLEDSGWTCPTTMWLMRRRRF